ncbi:MAG: LytTR family DNA-binding domain-containing protein [Salinivirgaceae bacterium]
MNTVIIDDEKKGRQTLRNFIQKFAPDINIVGEAENVEQGITVIDKVHPDLVFLDVQMPDGTGFDLLGQVTHSDFKIIFCTAFDHYAVKAFRFSAIDYLLKPVDPDIFMAAIKKACSDPVELSKPKIETLNANKQNFNRLALYSAEGITIVNVKDIVRCESSVNYTHFIMDKNIKILVSKTLKEYDELLCNHGFFRIHRSHLINLTHLKKYIKGEGGWVIMTDDSKIEVSRRKKEPLLAILGNI